MVNHQPLTVGFHKRNFISHSEISIIKLIQVTSGKWELDKDFKNEYTILQPGVIPPQGHGSLSYNTDTLQNYICPTINNIFEYQVRISTMQTENLLYGKRQDMMHETK